MEPTLAVKNSWSTVFAQGGEPSRVFIAHPCWWEGEEALCRQVRDASWASLLFTQLQKPLELTKGIESTQTMCSRAAAALWGGIRLDWDAWDVQEVHRKCKAWDPLHIRR